MVLNGIHTAVLQEDQLCSTPTAAQATHVFPHMSCAAVIQHETHPKGEVRATLSTTATRPTGKISPPVDCSNYQRARTRAPAVAQSQTGRLSHRLPARADRHDDASRSGGSGQSFFQETVEAGPVERGPAVGQAQAGHDVEQGCPWPIVC